MNKITDDSILNLAADNIRILAASMVEKAKSGHPGGAMGGADFMNVLFSKYLIYDPKNPCWFSRDRFFLDPGHMSTMLYSVLALAGKYSMTELQQFRQWGSVTPGHPELDLSRGIENTSGPLGQGHAMAVGSAIAERFLASRFGKVVEHKTYAYISDGGIQEEISQGAGRIAGYLGLSNLIMFYDSNNVQLSTDVDSVSNEDTAAKYRAWNWNVLEIEGNNPQAISDALENAINETQRPTIIIGRTIMGKGCVTADNDSFEGKCSTHGNPLSASGASYSQTIKNLGGNPDNPWTISCEVKDLYEKRANELDSIVGSRQAEYKKWAEANPQKAKELHSFVDGEMPLVDYSSISHKQNIATRSASADVLSLFADTFSNMIVSSADLANSDKTDAFLKKVGEFRPHDFSGRFLHAGVSELTMASIMNGIGLHGGLVAACATFFVFSDYMKPSVRLAALMGIPVKYIWTHDSFRVGEDGATHEPVEHEAQIRLLEELKNHSGKNSMLVLRPADSAETSVAWKMAMENKETPTALILTRQNVKDLPAVSGNRYEEALQSYKGGYVVYDTESPQIVLLANGSEVSILVDAADILKSKGISSRVVSIPSIGLFLNQSREYIESVLPSSIKRYGLTAGLPSTLRSVVGCNGEVFGLNHFGESAPASTLDEKFGFLPEQVAQKIQDYIAEQ